MNFIYKVALVAFGSSLVAGCATTPTERIKQFAHDKSAPISIYGFTPDGPNSVGGVGVRVQFINPTFVPYKYVRLTFSARNKVGDVVASRIGGDVYGTIEAVGPIPYGGGTNQFGDRYGPLWYNASINCVVLEKVQLVTHDNKILDFNFEQTKELISGGKNMRCK